MFLNLFIRLYLTGTIEYNFNRPHETLGYMTPIGFTQKYAEVSKRYSSNTCSCHNLI
jgi:transposase InsO family protein